MGRAPGRIPCRSHSSSSGRNANEINGKLKKLKAPSGPSQNGESRKSNKISTDGILIGAISRGLSYEGISEMEIGQVVDYCIEYNEFEKINDKSESANTTVRQATQADWDALGR